MWNDFFDDLRQVGEAIDEFFEKWWREMLAITLILTMGMVVGACLAKNEIDENTPEAVQAEEEEHEQHEQH